MKSTGNSELDAVIRRDRARKLKRAKRFAVVRWVMEVDYYTTEEAARRNMARLPGKRRAGIVDRQTGETWSSKADYRLVMATIADRSPRRLSILGVSACSAR